MKPTLTLPTFLAALMLAPLADSKAAAPDFQKEILPILKKRCFECHGPEKQKSGLRVDSRAALLKGGDFGAAVVPGNAAGSHLIEVISSTDDEVRMPPKGERLSGAEIEAFKKWIAQGTVWPGQMDAVAEEKISSKHWSFQPLPKTFTHDSLDAFGTLNENLPSFVAIADPRGRSQAGPNNWGSGFLPATFQGTAFSADEPPQNLRASAKESASRAAVDLLATLNGEHLAQHPGNTDLAARISSYELAGRMQSSIPGLMDLKGESVKTLENYGVTSSNTIKAEYARNCLLARRLLEQGVRVVQLFNGAFASGGKLNWDSHSNIVSSHGTHAEILDQPTAALLRELKQRGMLEKTLVVWCTEFGRLPFMQANGTGRDHNIEGFTCWLMGAGVKPGISIGSTDELGWKATDNVKTLYDFNATILHLLGLDHECLTHYFNGTERRITDVHGHLIKEVLA